MEVLLDSELTPEEVRTRIGLLSDQRQHLLLSPAPPERVLHLEEELDLLWDLRLAQETQSRPTRWQYSFH